MNIWQYNVTIGQLQILAQTSSCLCWVSAYENTMHGWMIHLYVYLCMMHCFCENWHSDIQNRGHENFHDDMNMSAIITWSMEFIATIIFFTYDQRHFIAMIQNILPWTTVFHSYDHHFHTWSGVIHSYEYWFIAWRVMISDHEQLLFMRFIYEN